MDDVTVGLYMFIGLWKDATEDSLYFSMRS